MGRNQWMSQEAAKLMDHTGVDLIPGETVNRLNA
jgi:hypothetical protein